MPTISVEASTSLTSSYAQKLRDDWTALTADIYAATTPATTSRTLGPGYNVVAYGFSGGQLRDGLLEIIWADQTDLTGEAVTWRRVRYTPEGVAIAELLDYQPQIDEYVAAGMTAANYTGFISSDERAAVLTVEGTAALSFCEYVNFDRRSRVKLGALQSLNGGAGKSVDAFSQKNGRCMLSTYVHVAVGAAVVGDVNCFEFNPDSGNPQLLYTWPSTSFGTFSQAPLSAVLVSDNYWWMAVKYQKTGDPYPTEKIKRFPLGSGTPDQEWSAGGATNANLIDDTFSAWPGWEIVDENALSFRVHTVAGTIREFVDGTVSTLGSGMSFPANAWFQSVISGDVVVWSNDAAGAPNYVEWWGAGKTPASVTRQSIVTSLLGKAGLVAADYDVSAITGNCRGYMVPRPMPVRQALEPLLAAFYLDTVESDGKIKFVNRGGSSVVTLATTDLAARAPEDEPPALLEQVRDEDTDLPVELQVRYFNADRDYQQGTQYARRLVSGAIGQVSMDLAIVLTDDEAKQIADGNLYAAWANRSRYTWRTSREFAKYEPGDVATLPQGADTIDTRITRRDDGANGVIVWEGVAEDASVFTQAGVGAPAQTVAQDIASAGPTLLELMDTVTLRDMDDGAGYYAAGMGLLSGWQSATLFHSSDGGESYQPEVLLSGGVIGTATTALGAWDADDNRWDTYNSVTFTLFSDYALSSATELQVDNGSNAILVGDEVIQFQTAIDNGSRSWTVSMLLRYRKGSEGVQTGAHAVGDRVVLLASAAAFRISDALADIGIARKFKAVTTGRTIASAEVEDFTDTGNSLKPLRVANVGKARDASDNLSVWWFDRERVNGEWRDLADVPSAEDSLSYEVDVRNAGDTATLRTITASVMPTPAAPVSYTAAQQTTDFGAPQSSIKLNIYKLSAQVGRGFVRSATI